ncbi:hypothetical protein ACCT17_25890 [Rhizobium ruizarguesonis]
MVTGGKDAIDLTTSPQAFARGLALANALYKELEIRGHPVRIVAGHRFIRPFLNSWTEPPHSTARELNSPWVPKAPTIATIAGVPIGLAIIEIHGEVLRRYIGGGDFVRASTAKSVNGVTWTETHLLPTGRFKITAYSPHFPIPWRKEWCEVRRHSIEGLVDTIVLELEQLATTLPHAVFFLEREESDRVGT